MIGIVCALSCEAKPLKNCFRLKMESGHPFSLYTNERIALIISGTGKIHAGAATSYLYAKYSPVAFLNVGIVGYTQRAIGEALLAHSIVDASDVRVDYPAFCFPLPCPTAALCTVDVPMRNPSATHAYDMEGSGFFRTAKRLASLEKIHCFKVVSDHGATCATRPKPSDVSHWIAEHIATIERLLSHLEEHTIPAPSSISSLFSRILARWPFTESQKTRAERLLTEFYACSKEELTWQEEWESFTSAREWLISMEASKNQLPLVY